MSQILVSGISVGSQYALLALSFWVIFAVTRTFHLAHVTTVNVAGYALYAGLVTLHQSLVVSIAFASVVAMSLGIAAEKAIYQPLRRNGASQMIIFVASSAVLIVGQAVLALIFGESGRGVETRVPPPVWQADSFVITRYDVANVVLAVVIGLVVALLLRHSRVGRRLRAVQGNARLSQYFGVDVNQVYRVSFGLGSLLAVPVVVTLVMRNGISPDLGFTPVLIAIIAVIAGGTESLVGAMMVGLLLGVLQNITLLWMSAGWGTVATFAALFLLLVAKPSGLRSAIRVRTG